VDTPIIMAGGVWFLREWLDFLDNPEVGPVAFQFGTRPLLTQESPISPGWKHRLLTLKAYPRFRVIPSMRFEYFLTLLKNARTIMGNSSAGIREAPVYGVPTLNLGSRQRGRFRHVSIVDVEEDAMSIAAALQKLPAAFAPSLHFGKGDSARQFLAQLEQPSLWNTPRQKLFRDLTPSLRPPDQGSGVVKVA